MTIRPASVLCVGAFGCALLLSLAARAGPSGIARSQEPAPQAPPAASEPPASDSTAGSDNRAPAPPAALPSPPAPVASERTDATLPPCIPAPPVHKPLHRHRKKPEEPQGPEPQAVPAPVSMQSGVVDAEVGGIESPLASILGKSVQSPKGEDLGRVVDVLTDGDGRVRAAIIDFGGFLGVGTRRIAIDWPLLRFDPRAGDKAVTLSVTREKLQSVPEYKDSTKPKVLMPPSGAATPDAANDGTAKK